MKRSTRLAPLLLCATIAVIAAACGSDDSSSSATTIAAPAATQAAPPATDAAPAATDAATPDTAAAGGAVKMGFITKFHVDFYDIMVDAAKEWNNDHPEVTMIYAQGASGTDD